MPDFDRFWNETISESKSQPLEPEMGPFSYPVKAVKVYDIYFTGFKGSRINAWYIVPENANGNQKVPALIHYHGYTVSKHYVQDYLKWSIQGCAVLAISVRGQGGKSNDDAKYYSGGIAGWMTKGILDKNEYYYRNVYMDCIRAIDFVCSREEIDTNRIGVMGGSQGGGLSIAAAALDDRVKVSMPDIPYLCHFRRSVQLYQKGPYEEIYQYFRVFDPQHQTEDKVYETLSYFDGMNLATKIKCHLLVSVNLMDDVCPPSTVFAAYNHMDCSKEIRIYPDHRHETLPYHEEEKFSFLAKHL
jgi:cephalosporin-C deacetylase